MRLRLRFCAVVCCASIFSACSGGGGGGGGNNPPVPPVAVAKSNVSQGQAPLAVTFDASGSTDPQGYPMTYTWSFSDGGTVTGVTASHTFQKHGTYTASVAVNDGHNTTTSNSLQIGVSAAPPVVHPNSLSMNVRGVAPTSLQSSISASDRESLPLTYSLAMAPTVGNATVDANTGSLTYTVPGFTTTASDSFSVNVTNGLASAFATVTIALNGDPLLPNQWHIQNIGQNAFSTTLPVTGNDMNVTGAWVSGYSGKGIKVGVIDSGLEAGHEDLAANVDLTHSYNFLTGLNDPTPSVTGEDHGTQVAGIIGAVAFNGKGGRGVAYNATLRGYNLLAPGLAFTVANMAKALGGDPVSSDNDLFNASWELTNSGLPQFSGAYQSITANAMTLRGNLGSAIVNAAGNEFISLSGANCTVAHTYGVSCGDPATDERRGGYYPVVVGAINAAGIHSSYSNTGSSLWISAPGGEYGFDSAFVPAPLIAVDPIHAVMPAITTTAHTACVNAPNPLIQPSPIAVNGLDDLGNNPLSSACQYTAVMNGTSSATPNTSGVIAMMLEANPKLSVRDVKYILAKTAQHVDPTFSGVSSTSVISGSTIVLEPGWVTNAGGYSFSNRYGFGAVNAAAAVAMAESYSSYLPAVQTSNTYSYTAPSPVAVPQSAAGFAISAAVSEPFNTVEFVVVFVNIDSTPGLPCNQIELTSPGGTKSIMLHAANGFTNAAIANTRFESNAFYGEPVNGTWTLKYFDFCPGVLPQTVLSTTMPQSLTIIGH
jgi:subtilisin family serine protease